MIMNVLDYVIFIPLAKLVAMASQRKREERQR
jgi:hypothetical protein